MGQEHEPHFDALTGKSTTGHEWDGIQELNTPLPKWWLRSIYASILWAIGYWFLYPAWPLIHSYTPGLLHWNARSALEGDLADLKKQRGALLDKIATSSLDAIVADETLRQFARSDGAAAFSVNCTPCHGAGGQGSKGYPNLVDNDWLWGGKLDTIYQTIQHGIRWDPDKDTRSGAMPSFGKDGTLNAEEIENVAGFVQSIAGLKVEGKPDLEKGKQIFADNCSVCHGDEGKGNQDLGAPNLTDKIWLYGPTKIDIVHRVTVGGGGVMPAWSIRLDDATIKSLAVYVHSLGGGQ